MEIFRSRLWSAAENGSVVVKGGNRIRAIQGMSHRIILAGVARVPRTTIKRQTNASGGAIDPIRGQTIHRSEYLNEFEKSKKTDFGLTHNNSKLRLSSIM